MWTCVYVRGSFLNPQGKKSVSYLSLCFKGGWKQSSNGICSRGALEPNQHQSDPNGPQESCCGEGSLMPITPNTHAHTHQSDTLMQFGVMKALKTNTSCTSGVVSNKHSKSEWKSFAAVSDAGTRWLWGKSHRGQPQPCNSLFICFTAKRGVCPLCILPWLLLTLLQDTQTSSLIHPCLLHHPEAFWSFNSSKLQMPGFRIFPEKTHTSHSGHYVICSTNGHWTTYRFCQVGDNGLKMLGWLKNNELCRLSLWQP